MRNYRDVARLRAPFKMSYGDVSPSASKRGRVKVHTYVATGDNARTGSPVPVGAEPFRQGREHGHGRFRPLLEYGV